MEVKSKIKALFNKDLRRYSAALCNTMQIQNNILKMDLWQRILTVNGIQSEQLGGATNRYVTMIDGYAVKFAMDRQGYKDNLMEYALTQELQPYVTKSYETNGYILIQQCVRILTLEEWRMRKIEILKILDTLGREYLLGDVGYTDVNRTNWGVTDDGQLVIVDYAYCHRLTEDLFTCPVCGSILSYDQNFVSFICTDRANCHSKYTYNQIKARQGDAVDWDMIKERKNLSLIISKDQDSINVNRDSDLLLDSRTFIIRNYSDLKRYKEAKNNMLSLDYTDPDVIDLITKLTYERVRPVPDKGKIARLEAEIEKYEKELPEVKCIIDPKFQEKLMEDQWDQHLGDEYDDVEQQDEEDISGSTFESLLEKLRQENAKQKIIEDVTTHIADIFSDPADIKEYHGLTTTDHDVYVDSSSSDEDCNNASEGNVTEEDHQQQQVVPEIDEIDENSVMKESDVGQTNEIDDVIGEPDSELDSAVEEELPTAPDDHNDEFTSEPVGDRDQDLDNETDLAISITTVGDSESFPDPEDVEFDGMSLSQIDEESDETQNDVLDNVEICDVEICDWYQSDFRWDTNCGQTHFMYPAGFNQPTIEETAEGESICPYCGGLIEYHEEEEEEYDPECDDGEEEESEDEQ